MTSRYLTLREVLAIHSVQIDVFGGSAGVRDLRLLEAAIFRPQSGYYDDVVAEAAALWESLAQNHPFVDGNKRTALAATLTFLKSNGIECIATPSDIIDFILGLYDSKSFTFANLEPWLRQNTRSI